MFYRAREISEKPFLVFDLVAYNESELKARKLDKDDFVLPFKPKTVYGVSEYKIENGKLVKRNKSDLQPYKDEFNTITVQEQRKSLMDDLIKLKIEILVLNDLGIDSKSENDTYSNLISQYKNLGQK